MPCGAAATHYKNVSHQLPVEIAFSRPMLMMSHLMCFTMSNWAAFTFGMFLSAI
jgi:hypothetical protein